MQTQPQPTEKPILFSGPMVEAIFADLKTVTRRVIPTDWWRCLDPDDPEDLQTATERSPWLVDLLWVKETFRATFKGIDGCGLLAEYATDSEERRVYPEGVELDVWDRLTATASTCAPWRPSIFMPRSVSRLNLSVLSVRAERLQDITLSEIEKEGLTAEKPSDLLAKFMKLWDGLNAARGYPWADDPWVWRILFKRMEAENAN